MFSKRLYLYTIKYFLTKYYEKINQKLNNTPAQYKSEFEWLKEVDSLALATNEPAESLTFLEVLGFPKFKPKKSNRLHNELYQWEP